MQKSSLYVTLALVFAVIVVFYSCTKKVSGLNNDQIVETPFSLLFSDTAGALYNSIDGHTIQRTMFKADGFRDRAICTSNTYILWAKAQLLLSTNNGKNFNHSFDSLLSFTNKNSDSVLFDLNQSMIINIPEWNAVYTVSANPDATNYIGVVFSFSNGTMGTWWNDLPDTAVNGVPGAIGNYGSPGTIYHISMTSFTMLKDGTLCGYDAYNNRNFTRIQSSLWHEVTAVPDSFDYPGVGLPGNHSGIPLPHRDMWTTVSPKDLSAWYSYGHVYNRLIAIDNKGFWPSPGYYSDDYGRNWTQYDGLPQKPLLCVASPFDQITLVGTDSVGLYELNTNTNKFQQQRNNGLGTNIVVRNIAAKEKIMKNGRVERYIYLATNQGIYESTDGGHNWVKTISGNFTCIY